MPRSKHQIIIDRYFPENPIAYQQGLVMIFDSPAVGLFLYQLLYWQDKTYKKSGWFYKTTEEIERETGLSRYNQETAIRILVRFGVIEFSLKGRVPRTRHFRVNMERLQELIPSLMESHGLHYLKPPVQSAVMQQPITKTTQETTTKNTIWDIDKFNFEKQRNRLIGLKSTNPP